MGLKLKVISILGQQLRKVARIRIEGTATSVNKRVINKGNPDTMHERGNREWGMGTRDWGLGTSILTQHSCTDAINRVCTTQHLMPLCSKS
ncbi:hypothetical protein FDUTEX481_00381 [Tolypothrix sp. PCC 7601]|nr:hypothetical protein FDUTEX481_00381 [Tolypothrix sp. PCC 7601]BAY92479.1 hypothetical protein NIES3275_45150 [Microchaete diplosiphon NIES-3275]